jgi:hypothetical protein
LTGKKRPALLVGSLNLANRDEVFDEVSRRLKDDVRAVPDGETGDRSMWVTWEGNRIESLPGLEVFDEMVFQSPVAGEFRQALMAPEEGVDLEEVRFGPFNYVKEAVASYEAFKKDREAGKFSPETRFQVSIPTPMMFAMTFPKHRLEALAAFERDLGEEIDNLFEAIPAEDLAIQWDIAGETEIQEQFRIGDETWAAEDKWPLEEITESIARTSKHIPEQALLGIHLCYGDPEGEHLLQPRDLGVCVDISNSAAELIGRRLDWVHMPVPIERDDDDYFSPLSRLKLKPETELYLGLIHKEDGIEGAKRRIEKAAAFVEDFGVATECGMGREPREQIPSMLDLHHEAATL